VNFILRDLPKISLNAFFGRMHWRKRKKIVDDYHYLVKSQFKHVLSKANCYEVEYLFEFKSNPLDASNCVSMVKLIEDVIFEDDNWRVVRKITIKSRKSVQDCVNIKIEEV